MTGWSFRRSGHLCTVTCLIGLFLLVLTVRAQDIWQGNGNPLLNLRQELLSPESENLRPPDRHARTRQYPSTQLGWNVDLVGLAGGVIHQVVVHGDRVYCASGSGLLIFDVSQPFAPALIGALVLPDVALGITLSLPYAYMADSGAGLRVIDISNPSSPREIGYVDTPGRAKSVALESSGRFAYVADSEKGVQIIDISSPAYPRLTGSFFTGGTADDVFIKDSYAYVADGTGVHIMDISDPVAPREVGVYSRSGARDVIVVGSRAYVAGGGSAFLAVVDVSDPHSAREVGYFDTPDFAIGVALLDDKVCVADLLGGVFILRFTGTRANRTPGVPVLVAPADNALVALTPQFTLRPDDADIDRVRFEIQVARGEDIRTFLTEFVDSGVEMVYTVPAEQTLSEGQWYWKARTVDSNGAVSAWSEARTFTARLSGAPSVPVLIQPVNNAVVTAVPTFIISATDPRW